MTTSRLLPLLGPVLVVYLAVQAAANDAFGLEARLLAALALLHCVPALLLRAAESGARRVATLGSLMALAFAARLGGEGLFAELLFALSTTAAGALVLDLALRVPDAPARLRALRPLNVAAAVASAGAGALASLPVFALGSAPVLVPPAALAAPPLFALVALGLTVVLRAGRRRLGSTPEALASNAWALTGTVPAAGLAAFLAFQVLRGAELGLRTPRGLLPLAALGLLLLHGHAALVDASRRPTAGAATRRIAAVILALGVVAAAAALLVPELPRDPASFALLAALLAAAALALERALAAAAHRVLAPHGGRLLDAIALAREGSRESLGLDELASALLGPMRRAGGESVAAGWLYTLTPPREVRVDQAGQALLRSGVLPAPVAERLIEAPGDLIVAPASSARVVREPALRPLVEILARWDALAVVPLMARDELEGCFVLPRGRRRTALGLEEALALLRLGREVGAKVALLTARERARDALGSLTRVRDQQAEALAAAEDAARCHRAEAEALRSGPAAGRLDLPTVAYAPAMRRLHEALDALAPEEAALTLVAETGVATEALARRVHAASGRAEAPFVVADGSALLPDAPPRALFGAGAHAPGWLRLAAGGTLVLRHAPALPREAQAALAEALALRQARPIHGQEAYAVDVRLVLTLRPGAEEALAPELRRWVEGRWLRVPPLRERAEDLPSLVLQNLDRACRVLGRPPAGIDEAAMDALAAYHWPGNVEELGRVLEHAAAHAEDAAAVIRYGDLPPLGPARTGDALSGSWAEIERRALLRALESASGNKSEAARSLGLKRTTFLDKLRRAGVEDRAPGNEGQDRRGR